MKKLIIRGLLVIISSTLFFFFLITSSCNKNETENAPMVGTWKEVSSSTVNCTNTGDNVPLTTCTSDCQQITLTPYAITVVEPGNPNQIFYYTRLDANTLTVSIYGVDATVTYTINGNNMTVNMQMPTGGCLQKTNFTRPAQPTNAALIGTWNMTSEAKTMCTNPADNQSLLPCTSSCDVVTITSTTITVVSVGHPDQVMPYTLVNDNLINATLNNAPQPITYSIVGNVMTIIVADTSSGCLQTMTFTKAS